MLLEPTSGDGFDKNKEARPEWNPQAGKYKVNQEESFVTVRTFNKAIGVKLAKWSRKVETCPAKDFFDPASAFPNRDCFTEAEEEGDDKKHFDEGALSAEDYWKGDASFGRKYKSQFDDFKYAACPGSMKVSGKNDNPVHDFTYTLEITEGGGDKVNKFKWKSEDDDERTITSCSSKLKVQRSGGSGDAALYKNAALKAVAESARTSGRWSPKSTKSSGD